MKASFGIAKGWELLQQWRAAPFCRDKSAVY
jgi:hypothetical protein